MAGMLGVYGCDARRGQGAAPKRAVAVGDVAGKWCEIVGLELVARLGVSGTLGLYAGRGGVAAGPAFTRCALGYV